MKRESRLLLLLAMLSVVGCGSGDDAPTEGSDVVTDPTANSDAEVDQTAADRGTDPVSSDRGDGADSDVGDDTDIENDADLDIGVACSPSIDTLSTDAAMPGEIVEIEGACVGEGRDETRLELDGVSYPLLIANDGQAQMIVPPISPGSYSMALTHNARRSAESSFEVLAIGDLPLTQEELAQEVSDGLAGISRLASSLFDESRAHPQMDLPAEVFAELAVFSDQIEQLAA